MFGSSWVAEGLAASQELGSMELVRINQARGMRLLIVSAHEEAPKLVWLLRRQVAHSVHSTVETKRQQQPWRVVTSGLRAGDLLWMQSTSFHDPVFIWNDMTLIVRPFFLEICTCHNWGSDLRSHEAVFCYRGYKDWIRYAYVTHKTWILCN
jgi:hypothetical protein